MKLKLTTNLGYVDAQRLGLDFGTAKEGNTIEAEKTAAEELLRHGWAVTGDAKSANVPPPTSADFANTPGGYIANESVTDNADRVSGAPAAAKITPAQETPDFDGMTKEELNEYARDHGISGVTMAQAKDDMLRTIKRATKAR